MIRSDPETIKTGDRSFETCVSMINNAGTMQRELWDRKAREKNLVLEDEMRIFINHKLDNPNYTPVENQMIRGFDSWITRAYPKKAIKNGTANGKKSTRDRIAGK